MTTLKCPRCPGVMAQEAECHSCYGCGSVWFGLEAARRFFAIGKDPTDVAPPFPLTPTSLSCPQCSGNLGHLVIDEELVLDQCEGCGGLLFEEGESLAMRGRLQKRGFRERVAQVIHTFRQGPYR